MKKSINWQTPEISKAKSYKELIADCDLALNCELCNCGDNYENAKEFRNTGDENLLIVENSTNCQCGGTGIILKT